MGGQFGHLHRSLRRDDADSRIVGIPGTEGQLVDGTRHAITHLVDSDGVVQHILHIGE